MLLEVPSDADEVTVELAGHRVRVRTRSKYCGRGCSGCPHPSTVVEVLYPSGRRRELWAEPPDWSGRRSGPPRTRRVRVEERVSVRGPDVSVRRTRR